jgi:methyl-accepting chemotaxis protein
MSDLRLDGTVFEDLRKTFSTISNRMETTRRTLRGTDGSVVGASKLVEDVRDFADEWGHGIKQLGKHTQNAVKMIDKIGESFSKLDQDLAESLKSTKKKGE